VDNPEDFIARYGTPLLRLEVSLKRNWGTDKLHLLTTIPGRDGHLAQTWELLGGHLAGGQIEDFAAQVAKHAVDAVWLRKRAYEDADGI
jgi:hypothetical protein